MMDDALGAVFCALCVLSAIDPTTRQRGTRPAAGSGAIGATGGHGARL